MTSYRMILVYQPGKKKLSIRERCRIELPYCEIVDFDNAEAAECCRILNPFQSDQISFIDSRMRLQAPQLV